MQLVRDGACEDEAARAAEPCERQHEGRRGEDSDAAHDGLLPNESRLSGAADA